MLFLFQRKGMAYFFIVSMLVFMSGADVSALEPATPLNQFGRQVWTMENGLPQNTISVLLQSRDGFLWAGTELGLARFDGVNFRVFDHATNAAFPDAEIRCLLDAGDSGLWAGTGDGLVLFKKGVASLFTVREGLPDNSIRGIIQITDGTIWVWTGGGLARWTGQRFQNAPKENMPQGEITSLATDAAGGIWIGTTSGAAVFRSERWRAEPESLSADDHTSGALGHNRSSLVKAVQGGDVLLATEGGVFLERNGALVEILPEAAMPADGVGFLDELSNGTIAVGSKSSVVLVHGTSKADRIARFGVTKDLPGSRIESIYGDREGSLWIGTNRGLARISTGGSKTSVQLLRTTDPLASNAVTAILEDREGDLWVGTETTGLHILRDARFRVIGSSDGLSSDNLTAIVEDTRKTLWIGSRDAGLNRISPLQTTNLTTANGLLSNVILSLAAARDGTVWIGTADGLNKIESDAAIPGRIVSYTSADGLLDDFIRSLLVAPDGSLWIGTRRGLTHLVEGRFQSYTQADGLGSDLVGAMACTPDGDLWIATLNGLTRLHQGKLHNYTTNDGLSSNVITALEAMSDGTMWIGTQDNGLSLWDGKRFAAIHGDSLTGNTVAGGLLPKAIHAVAHDDRGHLWLASDTGLARGDLQALRDCAEQAACRMDSTHIVSFTTADGLRSRETSSNSHPTVCHTSDGKLWFTTPRGAIIVDPLHFAAMPAAPPVTIERFAVDDRDVEAGAAAHIQAGALRFQFDYSGLSFASPQKLRYQYMLEGFDHTWTDAGTRRTAYYTNIPPAKYRFRVRATLGDAGFSAFANGSENASGEASYMPQKTAISFELLPHFYQTIWFRALVVVLVAALVFLAFRRRVIRVEREFGAVMTERNRIAREIHDTLAQGYVGISLQLEILGELLRHNRTEAAASHLVLTQGLVREGLDDARQSIWALRSHDAGEQNLPIRLRRLVEQAGAASLETDLEIHGAYRALASETEQEILRIAQEAIQNVKKHAAASRLSVQLNYDSSAVMLRVTDNGKGFTEGDNHLPSRGHFGLTGMRERAALIDAKIEITGEPGKGTQVMLSIPVSETRNKSVAPANARTTYPISKQSKEQL